MALCFKEDNGKVSGSINCQQAAKCWFRISLLCSNSLNSHILPGLKPGSQGFLLQLLLVTAKSGQAAGAYRKTSSVMLLNG